MSQKDFNAKVKELIALGGDAIKQPNMPVGEAVQEAENLVAWCTEDKATLIAAGLDWTLADDLPARAGACRYAQSIWARESQSREQAQQEWNTKSPAAFNLRDELVHHFLFAFRKHPILIGKVQTIREGGSNADMLQDLSDLSVLGGENLTLLEAIGFDVKLLTQAGNTADTLSAVLAAANGEVSDDQSAKKMRDKAYSYMKAAVDEIRAVGQYAFWRDEDRRRGYVSRYFRKKNQNKKKTSLETVSE